MTKQQIQIRFKHFLNALISLEFKNVSNQGLNKIICNEIVSSPTFR